jgi:hypothetical protein
LRRERTRSGSAVLAAVVTVRPALHADTPAALIART